MKLNSFSVFHEKDKANVQPIDLNTIMSYKMSRKSCRKHQNREKSEKSCKKVLTKSNKSSIIIKLSVQAESYRRRADEP